MEKSSTGQKWLEERNEGGDNPWIAKPQKKDNKKSKNKNNKNNPVI